MIVIYIIKKTLVSFDRSVFFIFNVVQSKYFSALKAAIAPLPAEIIACL